ncbi:hypothetical protein DCO58_07100 [Helicobacter saguini]|uniref:Uncharacterized protein n=1 Tax=Helicobacter saguini TaxID=1548018 RepID=A0A6B0HT77_9HELI|nr:RsmD family RNA methyltransferase [Helicobacter saguini]MWV61900.1 hypothetical protein [Helicobacter saguini]MWV67425.1 hypothetical protein [Helicobacter saguini]MWV69778.1 hypothetical protein [Helicobacter saguini]MWV73005.1 hypothetical protein [Helicobacter saguini]
MYRNGFKNKGKIKIRDKCTFNTSYFNVSHFNISRGRFKGLRLNLESNGVTRPTKSIVKKSFFDSLQDCINGVIFIECFAGSGQMGFEALSCGAKRAIFFEKDSNAYKNLLSNINIFNQKTYKYYNDIESKITPLESNLESLLESKETLESNLESPLESNLESLKSKEKSKRNSKLDSKLDSKKNTLDSKKDSKKNTPNSKKDSINPNNLRFQNIESLHIKNLQECKDKKLTNLVNLDSINTKFHNKNAKNLQNIKLDSKENIIESYNLDFFQSLHILESLSENITNIETTKNQTKNIESKIKNDIISTLNQKTLQKQTQKGKFERTIHTESKTDSIESSKIAKKQSQILLYLDPPFIVRQGFCDIYDKIITFIESFSKNLQDSIKIIVIEMQSGIDIASKICNFECYKVSKFGKTSLVYYKNMQS